jgi:hypothetical protein
MLRGDRSSHLLRNPLIESRPERISGQPLVTGGDVNNPRAAIQVAAEDVEKLIESARADYSRQTERIRPGCLARALGELRDYCGSGHIHKTWLV